MISPEDFRGSLVSIDCGEQGYFQGRVTEVDHMEKYITIEKPFKDGIPMNESKLKLFGNQIMDMKVLQMPEPDPEKLVSVDVLEEQFPTMNLRRPQKLKTNSGQASDNEQVFSNYPSKKRQVEVLRERPTRSNIPLHSIPASVLHDQSMVDKVRKTESVSSPIVKSQPIEGVRISINDLLAARPSSSGNSIEGSGNTSPTSSIVPKYKEFGQFKLFETHQVPEPCRLRVNKNRRAPGPCGIPSLDCSNGYGHFSSKHPELSQPLDFKLMNTDFDFDANLALFNKESLSDNEKESSSPELRDAGSSTSRNFRHDENILDDPSRVISWLSNSQQQVATMFKPLRLESTNEGFLIPVLSSDDKLRYLKEAENFLGSDVLYSIVADRLLLYVLNIMDRFELLVKTVVVLVSESTPEKLASRTLQHLSNRSCTTVVYGIRSNARNSLPYISFVDQVSKIPVDTQLVIILNNSPLPKALQMWLKRVGNGPDASHIISFENKALDVAHPHTLYVGTLVEQSYTTSSNGKHSVFRESAVTEVGCPFGWFEEESYQALIEAFGSQVFVNF